MTEKRFNCHVKFSAMPNGIMVLDYERHGDEQTVIEDISREKAHRVMDRLNELNDEKQAIFDRIMKEIHFNDKQYVETKDECFKYTSIALSNILRQFGVI